MTVTGNCFSRYHSHVFVENNYIYFVLNTVVISKCSSRVKRVAQLEGYQRKEKLKIETVRFPFEFSRIPLYSC